MCEKQGPPVEAAGASTENMSAERDETYNATATESQPIFKNDYIPTLYPEVTNGSLYDKDR